MSIGILGKKLGMTQLYDGKGALHAVTIITAGPCTVLQKKTSEKEKYMAYQLGFDDQKEKNVSNPLKGHFKKTKSTAKRFIREFHVKKDENFNIGDHITVAHFKAGEFVDVIGISKGKGFQGVVRRWRFAGGGAAHGSKSHRRAGAIGMRAWPGRIWKNHRMPGHMGHVRITTQNLPVLQVHEDKNLLIVGGSVPGSNGSYLVIRPAIKKITTKTKL